MTDSGFIVPLEQVQPDYAIWKYTDSIFKIVYFKSGRRFCCPPPRSEAKNETKFSQSISRAAKVILELALCNDWKYFATLTLDPDKYDRFDLDKFREDLSQLMRDLRKKAKKQGFNYSFDYLLVPELHKDGAWHMHGFFSDMPAYVIPFHCLRSQGVVVPDNLVYGSYFDFPDFSKRFGFCSLGLLHDKVAASFYVTKYLTKYIDDSSIEVGRHTYFGTQGLNRRTFHGDCYGHSDFLDQFLTHDYEFCKTGFTHSDHCLDWSFALEYMSADLQAFVTDDFQIIPESCKEIEYMQESFFNFGG